MQEGDDLTMFLDHQLAEVGVDEPTPSPSPSVEVSPDPYASPTPTPTPTPLSVRDDDLVQLVREVHRDQLREQHGSRIADTGSFIVLCLILSLVIAGVLFSALRRK